MKAAVLRAIGDLGIEDLPSPAPGVGEVLLEPLAVGICGTDAHIFDGHYPSHPPVILGHETAARVIERGSGVRAVEVGDLVTVEPHRYCGSCAYCRLGKEHLCVDKRAFGVSLPGGMAELMVVPAANAFRVPETIAPSIAALTEPLSCCVHGMDQLQAQSGLPLLLFGCGPAGSILIALARLAGLGPIVAVDTRPERRDLAERMGADFTLDYHAENFEDAAREVTGGLGFPYLVDAVGSASVLETCLRMAGRGARLLVFGVAPPNAIARISPNEIYTKELAIVGTAVNPHTYSRAIGLLERLDLGRLNVAQYPLTEVSDALEISRVGTVHKVQVIPNAEATDHHRSRTAR